MREGFVMSLRPIPPLLVFLGIFCGAALILFGTRFGADAPLWVGICLAVAVVVRAILATPRRADTKSATTRKQDVGRGH